MELLKEFGIKAHDLGGLLVDSFYQCVCIAGQPRIGGTAGTQVTCLLGSGTAM